MATATCIRNLKWVEVHRFSVRIMAVSLGHAIDGFENALAIAEAAFQRTWHHLSQYVVEAE